MPRLRGWGPFGLRGRIVGAVLVTTVATLAVAAVALLGPLEHSLRNAARSTLRNHLRNSTLDKFRNLPALNKAGTPDKRLQRLQSQLESTISATVTVLGYPGINGADGNVVSGPPGSTDAVDGTDPDVVYAFRTRHPRYRFLSVDGVEYVQAAIPFRNAGLSYVLVARKSIDEIGDAIGVASTGCGTSPLPSSTRRSPA